MHIFDRWAPTYYKIIIVFTTRYPINAIYILQDTLSKWQVFSGVWCLEF